MLETNLVGKEILFCSTDPQSNDVETFTAKGIITTFFIIKSYPSLLIYDYKTKGLYERRATKCILLTLPVQLIKKQQVNRNEILDIDE